MTQPSRLDAARIKLEHRVISVAGLEGWQQLKGYFFELENAIRAEQGQTPRRVVLPGEPQELPWAEHPAAYKARRQSTSYQTLEALVADCLS